ncbi:MAG TPA: aminotransferase class V-fold PLP-dependent enzyme [Steroidobacteraceae bacterium]|nr:aminotransferase class V-fold PLP-dependent enzyme [Steroidobacteraceae bacterium]
MRPPVYLDYAATTPVDPQVARALMQCLTADGVFANASSSHGPGRAAAELIERARGQVAALIGAAPEEIVFTSGATESNNLAVLGCARGNADRGRHIVSSRIEHKALLDPCRRLAREGFRVTYVDCDPAGRIDPERVSAALSPDTVLVSIMHVNNEIGVIEDVAAIAAACRQRGITFHTDAAQSAGRVELDLGSLPIDLLSLTAHKIYGPKGIGALYVRRSVRALLRPQSFGGGQERGLRPGTLPTHQIVAFGAAAELAARSLASEHAHLTTLRDRLWSGIARCGGVLLNGQSAPRVPHILNVSFEDVEGESLVAALPTLALSTGSACHSATGDSSYVLRALGRGPRLAESSLRFSLGRFTTIQEIDYAVEEVCRELGRLRAVCPVRGGARTCAGEGSSASVGGPLDSSATAPIDADASAGAARFFRDLPGAGVIPDSAGTVVRGEAGGPGEEVWVRFHLLVDGDSVKDARFEARGCPHTLATAAWLSGVLRGRRREEALHGGPQAWARVLGVPVEKLGRLLVIEDALNASLRSWPPMGQS